MKRFTSNGRCIAIVDVVVDEALHFLEEGKRHVDINGETKMKGRGSSREMTILDTMTDGNGE